MKIVIGADKAGYDLKEAVVAHLTTNSHEITDLGPDSGDQMVSFVEVADKLSEIIASGNAERGILICGTGMGMALTANKHKGIYAAVVESVYAARLSRLINNANVLCVGGFIVANKLAADIVDVFLETEFLQDFQQWRVDFLTSQMGLLKKVENRNFKE
jgi:ribose 5-phosphate isomerase B